MTDLHIFEENMDSDKYIQIINDYLLPSAARLYPNGNWMVVEDGDPKHSMRCYATNDFFVEKVIKRVLEHPLR
jgi:hypothetical protein